MNRVVHFEIHAENPERAAKFYAEMFDWTIKEWAYPGVEVKDENRYWLVTTGEEGAPGINGGILFRKGKSPTGFEPITAFICTVDVESVDESLKLAVSLGGQISLPKMPIMGMGWLAYAKDTEGNIFGLMQTDKKAE